jgi:hypothetical protein
MSGTLEGKGSRLYPDGMLGQPGLFLSVESQELFSPYDLSNRKNSWTSYMVAQSSQKYKRGSFKIFVKSTHHFCQVLLAKGNLD